MVLSKWFDPLSKPCTPVECFVPHIGYRVRSTANTRSIFEALYGGRSRPGRNVLVFGPQLPLRPFLGPVDRRAHKKIRANQSTAMVVANRPSRLPTCRVHVYFVYL